LHISITGWYGLFEFDAYAKNFQITAELDIIVYICRIPLSSTFDKLKIKHACISTKEWVCIHIILICLPQIAAKVVFAKSSIFHYNASVNQKMYPPKDMLKDQSSVPKYRSPNSPNPGITRNSSFNATSISDVTIFNDGNLLQTQWIPSGAWKHKDSHNQCEIIVK